MAAGKQCLEKKIAEHGLDRAIVTVQPPIVSPASTRTYNLQTHHDRTSPECLSMSISIPDAYTSAIRFLDQAFPMIAVPWITRPQISMNRPSYVACMHDLCP